MKRITSELEDQIPDYNGRVLFVHFSNKETDEGRYIANPQLQMLGGRLFLVGTPPETSKVPDSTFCIAWDRIDAYLVADSIAEFKPLYESSDEEDKG